MSHENYEPPRLTVLGSVEDLTEGKSGPESDQAGVDGGGSFLPLSDVRLKRDIEGI